MKPLPEVVACAVLKDDHLLQVAVLYDEVDENIYMTLFGSDPKTKIYYIYKVIDYVK